jgi:hypothetical protein
MFATELSHDGHTRRFSILRAGERGWEIREEADSKVVRQALYSDWHRVERAMTRFALQVSQLAQKGWQVSR